MTTWLADADTNSVTFAAESTKIASAPEPLLHAKQLNANELESLNKKELLKLLVKPPQPQKLEDLLKLKLNKML